MCLPGLYSNEAAAGGLTQGDLGVSALAGLYRIAVRLLPGPGVRGPVCHIESSVTVSIQLLRWRS